MQRRYIPVLAIFAILLMLLAHFGGRLAAVPVFTYAEEKQVYLTFDDGPSTRVTGRVLDILKEEDVKATFFVVGDRVAGREETLRRIAEEGHTIGVHSMTHLYSSIYASDEALLKDVSDCAAVIGRVTGIAPHVYRFPGGGNRRREHFAMLLRKQGYRVVRWNAVCGDEEIPGASPSVLAETAAKTAGEKSCVVLLLHDSAHHMATAEALPEIIAHFRGAGYTFCAF